MRLLFTAIVFSTSLNFFAQEYVSVFDIISESESHNILETAIVACELDSILSYYSNLTLFAPTEDRDVVGEGFTHKIGDKVTISEPNLGKLVNYVNLSTACPQWKFGISSMIKNLSQRGLI